MQDHLAAKNSHICLTSRLDRARTGTYARHRDGFRGDYRRRRQDDHDRRLEDMGGDEMREKVLLGASNWCSITRDKLVLFRTEFSRACNITDANIVERREMR